jgi:hypothetical protein
MTLLPVAAGARLLGIHPKTLHHWRDSAKLPLTVHPTDARIRCMLQEHLVEVARWHGRPLPDLASVPALERDAASSVAQAHVKPLPAHEAAPASLSDVRKPLAQLHTHVTTLQQQLAGLALELLQERTEHYDQRLHTLEALAPQSLESFQGLQEADVGDPLALSPSPERRLLPVEVRARSRVTALIEYGAQG